MDLNDVITGTMHKQQYDKKQDAELAVDKINKMRPRIFCPLINGQCVGSVGTLNNKRPGFMSCQCWRPAYVHTRVGILKLYSVKGYFCSNTMFSGNRYVDSL
jgi:hypothetical protein